MSIKKIKALIESFYEGKASREEEILLFDYFKSTDVPEELQDEKKIFLALYEEEFVEVPSSLEGKLINTINELDKKEKKRKIKKRLMLCAGVAASIAIIISAGYYLTPAPYKGNYSNITSEGNAASSQFSESDYIEAEKAILLLSTNFNEGIQQIGNLNHKLEETNDIIRNVFNLNN